MADDTLETTPQTIQQAPEQSAASEAPQIEVPQSMLATAGASLGQSLVKRKVMRRRAARQARDANGIAAGADEAVSRADASSGAPLPENLQQKFSSSLGADLSQVRVHNGESSANAANVVSAQAYTTGKDIHFAAGQYNPASGEGEKLLAHEVAHTVQQQGSAPISQAKLEVSTPGDSSEVEADNAAEKMVGGKQADVSSATGVARQIMRYPGEGFINGVVKGAKDLYHDAKEALGLEKKKTEAEIQADKLKEDQEKALQAFVDHGVYGPKSLVAPTGIGGFEAAYAPKQQILAIAVNGSIEFKDGLTIDNAGTISSTTPDLDEARDAGNSIRDRDPAKTLAKRKAFVAQFHWTDQDSWLANLNQRVAAAWSGKHFFHCTRTGWEKQLAMVAAKINITKGVNKGSKNNVNVTTYKVPESGLYTAAIGSVVNSSGKAQGNAMTLGSTDIQNGANVSSLLKGQVLFGNNSATLTDASKSSLAMFIKDFKQGGADKTNPIELVGRASSTGSKEHNTKLAQRRIDVVRNYLKDQGLDHFETRLSTNNQGDDGADESAEWRRVDLIVSGGQGMFIAAHEFGHQMGLDDEYSVNPGGNIQGTGGITGQVTGHDQMAKAIGQKGAISENNDSIMSLGSVVRPQHYATFGWALGEVTGVKEWAI